MIAWQVEAKGAPAVVLAEIKRQLDAPLAFKPDGLSDDRARKTVRRLKALLEHMVVESNPGKELMVAAHGHITFDSEDHSLAHQHLSLEIGIVR